MVIQNGGYSRLNPITGKGEYVLPSGLNLPTTPLSRAIIDKSLSTTPQIDTRMSQRLDIPDIQSVGDYDSRSGMYVLTSPTGKRGTSYMQPPSPSEQAKIDAAQYKGSIGYAIDVTERKVVTPVLEYFKPVTTAIRETPLTTYGLLKIAKGKDTTTVGEGLLKAKEVTQKVLDISGTGWGYTSNLFFKKAEEKKGITKNILEAGGYVSKGIGFGVKTSEPIIQYSALGLVGGATVDILITEEKIAKPEKYIKEVIDKEYEEYEEKYKKQLAELPEGYELESKLSKEEYTKDNYGDIEKQVQTGLRRETVVPFLFLTGGVAAKGYGALTKARVVEGSVKGGKGFEIDYTEQQIARIGEKGIDISGSYKKLYIKPATTVETQSIAGKFFGKEPKINVLQRGNVYIDIPAANILGEKTLIDKPYLLVSGRVGKAENIVNKKFSIIAGGDKPINLKDIKKLSGAKQDIFSKLKGDEFGNLIIKDTEKLSSGKVVQIELYGKTPKIRITDTGSVTRKTLELESGASIIKVDTGFAGKTIETQKGTIFRSIDLSDDVGSSAELFLGGTGKKSSADYFAKLYQEQTTKVVTAIPKLPVMKVPPVKSTPSLISDLVVDTTSNLPRMVGGSGVVTSEYWGTGQYEITETSPVMLNGINMNQLDTGFSNVQIDILRTNVNVKTDVRLDTKLMLDTKSRLDTKSMLKSDSMLKSEQVLKPALKSVQLLKQATKQVQILKQTTKQPQKETPKTPKTTTTIKPVLTFGETKEKKIKTKAEEDLFKIFKKTKGQAELIGEAETETEAFRKLKKGLKQTLSASGWVEKKGEKINVGSWTGGEFRKAKRSDVTLVQRRGFRLGTGSEVFQIKQTKKLKRKGGFFK